MNEAEAAAVLEALRDQLLVALLEDVERSALLRQEHDVERE
jgi:hypothetical protein